MTAGTGLRAQPPAEVVYDLRGDRLPAGLTLIGPGAEAVAQAEAAGLRFTLPATRKENQPVGVAAKVRLTGDFEVTGTYELLAAERPPGGVGVGVALNLAADPGYRKFAKVGRFVRPQKGDVHLAEFWLKDDPDPARHRREKMAPTAARAGRLRLAREGTVLRYLATDGPAEEFKEIYREAFTDEDVPIVRFVVNNNGAAAAVDARLLEFRFRSGGPGPAADPGPADAPADDRPRTLLILAGLLALLVLMSGLGGWLYARRRAAPRGGSVP